MEESEEKKISASLALGGDDCARMDVNVNVPPDEPEMRAVALRSGPEVLAHDASASRGFGSVKPPPSFGVMRPSPLGLQKSAGPEDVFAVKKEWSGLASRSVWDVKPEYLEMVPMDFPLERTHREILDDASVVSSRISEALRSLSIEAEFDCRNAKAKCNTGDSVAFRIRLYAGGENGKPVVVEMQRRCGSASSFMVVCRALLAAAEGRDVVQHSGLKKEPPFAKMPVSKMQCLKLVAPPKETYEASAMSAIRSSLEMLRSKKHDTNVLGLENLCFLTDPTKTAPAVAVRASQLVVKADDEMFDVREELRPLTERDTFSLSTEELSPVKQSDHLRYLALHLFANALSTCTVDGWLVTALNGDNWYEDHLVPSLLVEVKNAANGANTSCQAVKCLGILSSCSLRIRQHVIAQGGLHALQAALDFGIARHQLLADESRRSLKALSA